MKHRRVWLFVLGFVFSAAFVAIMLNFFFGEREPVYQGRKLSSWLDQANGLAHVGSMPPEEFRDSLRQGFLAVRQIGTNAIPWLLKMTGERTWPLEDRLNAWLYDRKLSRLEIKNAWTDHNLALTGFYVLGADAASAIPALTKMLDDKDPGVRRAAAECLGAVGDGRDAAMKDAIQALVRHVNDSDAVVCWRAIEVLGQLRSQPALVLPVLIRLAETNQSDQRKFRIILLALGQYGTNAMPAIRLLQELSTNTNAVVREEARNALQKITNSTPNPH